MLEKERNSMREELNDELNEQWIKLDEAVMKSLWGNHRAARTVKDRLKILNSLTIRDILRFRKKFYIPKLTTIVISADTPLQKSQDMARKLALALPNHTQSIPKPLAKIKPKKVQTKEVVFHQEYHFHKVLLMRSHRFHAKVSRNHLSSHQQNNLSVLIVRLDTTTATGCHKRRF